MITINGKPIDSPSQTLTVIHSEYPDDWSDLAVLALLPYPDTGTLHKLWSRHYDTLSRKHELARRYSFISAQGIMSEDMRITFMEDLRRDHPAALLFLTSKAADYLRPRWQIGNHRPQSLLVRTRNRQWQRLTLGYLNALGYAQFDVFEADLLKAIIPGLYFDCEFAYELYSQFLPFQELRFAQNPRILRLLTLMQQVFDEESDTLALETLTGRDESSLETDFILHLLLAQRLVDKHQLLNAANVLDRASLTLPGDESLMIAYYLLKDTIEEYDDLDDDDSEFSQVSRAEKEILLNYDRERVFTCFESGDYESALTILNRIIRRDPDNPSDYVNRANCNMILKHYRTAENDLTYAWQLDSRNGQIPYLLAVLYTRQSELNSARDMLSEAIALDEHYRQSASNDPEFKPIKDIPYFASLFT